VVNPGGTDASSGTDLMTRATATPSTTATSTVEAWPLFDPAQSAEPTTMGTAAAARASSVAWMLLALDMGAFAPGLIGNRDREASAAS
jgi:hypothetical protein